MSDKFGRIFVADDDGIKMYDGVNWSFYRTPGNTTVRSLAADGSGIIYFGEQGDFGRTYVGGNGLIDGMSFKKYALDKGVETIDNVWGTHVVNGEILFQTKNYIIKNNNDDFSLFYSGHGFHNAFSVEDTYFVREFDVGLKILKNNNLTLVNNGDLLSDKKIFAITSNKINEFIIWTQENGQYIYNSSMDNLRHYQDYPEELQNISKEYRLYHGAQLPDGSLAIGTLGAGVYFVDDSGHIIAHYDESQGLPDNFINYVHVTNDGNIWLALNSEGLAYLSKDLTVTRYGRHHGLAGYINALEPNGDYLSVATGSKLFNFDTHQSLYSPDPLSDYAVAIDSAKLVWDYYAKNGYSVTASEEFISVAKLNKLNLKYDKICHYDDSNNKYAGQAFTLYYLENGSALVGRESGVSHLKYGKSGCELRPFAPNVSELEEYEIWSIAKDDVSYWFGTKFKGLLRLHNSNGNYVLDKFSNNAPSLGVEVAEIDNSVVFYDQSGIYRYDEVTNQFQLWENITPQRICNNGKLDALSQDSEGKVWLVYEDSVVVAEKINGIQYTRDNIPALEFEKTSTSAIYHESPDITWFNDSDELIKYDRRFEFDSRRSFNTLIGNIVGQATGDTLFYGNFATPTGGFGTKQTTIPNVLYNDRVLTIELGATYFYGDADVQHRYRKVSLDSTWSDWISDSEITLRNDIEGAYTVEFQSRDGMGRLSNTATYSYVVLPPIYRTWWAYLIYVIGAVLFGFTGQRYVLMRRAHRIAAEQARELEQERRVVKRLQVANDRLKQANKLKDEFLATTSHELRTPLTAILGFTSVLKEEVPKDAEYHEFLDIIEDSGTRLMETLNSLLDLAKLRAGIMDLEVEEMDPFDVCENVASDLLGKAERKGIGLEVIRPRRPLRVSADSHAVSRVLHQLVGNAIKFTEEGKVEISFSQELVAASKAKGIESENDDRSVSNGVATLNGDRAPINRIKGSGHLVVWVHVKDTGIGIDEKFLPDLFEEYAQESDGLSRTYEGSGLGLAISARIVQIMGGLIKVESLKGEGSTFSFALPEVGGSGGLALKTVEGSGWRENPVY